jgi:putative ABC transport system permease protein
MLLSYLKIAWKVLLRRKFFTAISLFGISFTLMILLVVYALVDYAAGAHRPVAIHQPNAIDVPRRGQ